MSGGGSAASLFGYYAHPHPHSRISHSDPSYQASPASNNYSGSVASTHDNSHDPAASTSDSLSGSSKRPFPFPLGSQERDKRARSCEGHGASGSGVSRSGMWEGPSGTWSQARPVPEGGEASGSGSGMRADEEDAQIDQDTPNQETASDGSSYASATELPQSPPIETARQSTTIPFSAANTNARQTTYVPIDATSTSYPMEPMTNNRGTSPAPRIPTPAALRSSSPLELPILSPTSSSTSTPSIPAFLNPNGSQRASSPARLPPLRSPSSSGLDRLPPLSMHALTGPEVESPDELESAVRTRGAIWDLGWITQGYDEAPTTQTPPPVSSGITNSRPQESQNEVSRTSRPDPGNAERSARPLRALPGTRRVGSPPPLGSSRLIINTGVNFGSSSVDSGLPTSAFSERRMPLPRVDLEHDWMTESTSSGFASRAIHSGSSVVGSDGAASPFGSAFSPGLGGSLSPGLGGSLSPIVNGPASPSFGGLASPIAVESVASTVQSDDESNPGAEPTAPNGHPTSATLSSPSTSGSSASTRTTPSGYTRRPPSLSLRGFPTSPTFSSMSGPVSASESFVDSPTFPVSASPRTSTFDLAVTPPGSALPSFVARMMEVDSPVREGADHAYTIPELVLEPRAENDAASIDALRRFARNTPGDAPGTNLSEQSNPEIRREPIRFPLSALGTTTVEDLSARSLRQFDETDPAPLFPPPRQESEHAQRGSSNFSQPSTFPQSSFSTVHQLDESGPAWSASRPSDLGSAYSQRLTESGMSYPSSRPSASDTSYPSFRANVSTPGLDTLNMGSRPGRLVRDMSWSFSDVFRPGSTEALSGSSSDANLREHQHEDNGREGVRSALSRAARVRGNESLPRLHLNALPRATTEDEQSQTWTGANNNMTASATNLSRTPPGPGGEHDVPSFAEAWLEEGSTRARPPTLQPRRMSGGPRWMDLFSESSSTQPVAVPTAQRLSNRPRMPPAIPMSSADSTLFDPLSGMSWPSDSHSTQAPPFVEQQQQQQQTSTSAQDSLARYQTFAQSIDELRRSPAHLQQPSNPPANPWGTSNAGTGLRLPPVIAPSTTTAFPTGLDTARTESTGLSGISTWYNDGANNARPPWATPRHEPLPMLDEPRRSSRSSYGRNNDNRQPPPLEPARAPAQPVQGGGNWLREWERERNHRSQLAREDYMRRRETEVPNNLTPPVAPFALEQRRRAASASIHRPLTQLSETQAQGRMWDEYTPRHEQRPWPVMTRASLANTGFADDEWPSNGNSMDLWGNIPRRRPEVLPPPRSNEAEVPAQYTEPSANRISDLPFTESPPSLLQEFIDMSRNEHYNDSFSTDVFQSFRRTNTQPQTTAPNPPDFRHASEALRRSLHRTSRERDAASLSRPVLGQARSPSTASSRRFLGQGEGPVQAQPGSAAHGHPPERSRLSFSRDRWDQLARSQSQLERMRQLLHTRSGETRERDTSRRRLTDLGRTSATQTSRRRSFMSALDTEPISPTSQWPRDFQRPSSLRQDDRSSWSSTESPSSRPNHFHEQLIRAASRVRRRRTLLPESSTAPPRPRPTSNFLDSMGHALHQVESGLQHINRELSALADESDGRIQVAPRPPTPESRMDWTYDDPSPVADRSASPPPRLPPFEFSQLQRNVDWPSSRRNTRYEEEDERSALSTYLEHRQAQRDALPRAIRASYTYDTPWPGESEPWANDGPTPTRDRVLFRASAPSRGDVPEGNATRARILRHPDGRDNNASSSTQQQQIPQPTTSFGRLHHRRASPPASSNNPPPAPTSASPPPPPSRSYSSRFSHFLPRRTSTSRANSDDNDEWIQPGSGSGSHSRMFFLRPRGRMRTTSTGDFLRDEEFDDSYEGLLRLAARIGDAKPRGTPAEVIQAMPTGRYASCAGAKAESRCPICLDDYGQEDIVALIKGCSHWFHKECITQWLGNSRTCPVCRGQVDGEAGTEPEAGPSSNVSGDMW